MKRLWSNQARSKRFASNPDDPASWVTFREKMERRSMHFDESKPKRSEASHPR